MQKLFPSDLPARKTFGVKFLARMEMENEWPWKILRTGEAHFHLTGYVNTQNCQIWATENPYKTQPVPLHPTISFIIEPNFFKEVSTLDLVTVTVTGQRYECLLHNHVIPALQ